MRQLLLLPRLLVDSSSPACPSVRQIGFFALLLVEAVADKPILEMLGLQLGNGINIGF